MNLFWKLILLLESIYWGLFGFFREELKWKTIMGILNIPVHANKCHLAEEY
uniref:Uncharacterized protein n=1 Tax=Rhizophora mucronata TaxID=61149 RepID=A0A2P2NGL3_RHIMU